MATREEIEAARLRVENARQLLAEEQARAAEAARDAETDVELVALEEEAAVLEAAIQAAQADTERQVKANAERKGQDDEGATGTPVATNPVPEQPVVGVTPAPDPPVQSAFPFGAPQTNGDNVTGKE